MNQKMMRDLQNKMMKIQEDLAEETVETSVGDGAVTAVMTGQQQLRSIKIDPEIVDADDLEMLEDLVVAVVNQAIAQSQELAAQRMGVLTGGLKLPGM
ncbi:MAG: YbaB/EbfC family nucleoid-associated protein [Chloroflexota bacterium]|nr:YbaB/EbfC family nucleoid-associated protein [Chloroflexota bacterium]